MTRMTEADKKQRLAAGINMKQMRACELRADGYTQFNAYCLSHKVSDEDKSENKGPVEDKAYKLFKRPKVRAYLRELLAAKLMEDIISRQEWILSIVDDIDSAREAKNWPAVMNGQRQVGLAIAALRESGGGIVIDGAERDKEIIAALSGENPTRRKQLEQIMGKHEVFEPTLVVDNKLPSDK